MKTEAYGTFQAFNKKVFRTNAYLRLGNSNQAIGLIVMLNPGSSQLANEREWSTFKKRCDSGEEFSETNKLKLDPTMISIREIFSKLNPKLQGILQIYNLFNYRCGNSDDAIKTYSTLLEDSHYSSILHSPFPNIEDYSWIWTAWSVKDNALLNNRKQEVIKIIEGKRKIALYSQQKKLQKKKELYCFHPSPQKKETKDWVQTEVIKELKDIYSTNNNLLA